MDIKVRRGETLELSVTADDLTADTVRLVVSNDAEGIIIDETESFSTVDDERVATISTTDTVHPLGDYEYMLVVEYSDGFIEKLPDAVDCDEDEADCSLPTLTICEALDLEVS